MLIQGNCFAGFNPQKLYLKNINLKDGLSQIVVTEMTIDNLGFLWAGTFDGLNRFDGTTIKVFRHNPSNATSLPSSTISKVFADRHQHLYLRTNAGFCVFDCKTEKVIKPEFAIKYKPVWVAQNTPNDIWVYTADFKLLLVNTQNLKVIKVASDFSASLRRCEVLDMVKVKSSLFIANTCGDIIEYDVIKDKSFFYDYPDQEDIKLQSLALDKNKNLFITSSWNDFIYFNTTSKQFSSPLFNSENSKLVGVNKVYYDSTRDVLFMSTYGQGLFVYDYKANSFTQFKKGDTRLPIAGNYLLTICNAPNGMLYIGYDGAGIDAMDPYTKQFVPITKDDTDDSKTLNFVRKIIEDDQGNLLIGTAGNGLIRYNIQNELFSFFPMLNKLSQANNFVIELMKVDSEVWLGFNGSGIGIADLNTLKIKNTIEAGNGPTQITEGTIWSLLDDEKGSIWVGTREGGINIINKSTRLVKQYTVNNYPAFKMNGIRTLFLKKDKSILIGTEKGLFTLNTLNDKLLKLFPTTNDEKLKSYESIKSIYEDKQGRIWLGTFGGGIAVLDKKYQLIRSLNTDNYLNNNVVYAILPQNDSVIWISTNAGLSKINWNESSLSSNGNFKSHHFDEMNGLQSNEFNTGAHLLLKNGSMAFGGSYGINLFHPNDIKTNPQMPKVYISELKIFENPFNSDTIISYIDEVYLKHYENAISLSFNTLGFTIPGKTRYQYRLIGYDNTWINANNRNYVSYTNLNSGVYEFQVRASSSYGDWGDQYRSLKIHIATPFYRTWWFIVAVIAIIAYIIYAIYRYRMKQIMEKERIRIQYNKDLAEVEMKALRAQINPHFLFNSLNSINNFILKNDTDKASKYLIKFSQLVRNILNNSSSPFVSLQEELQTIELYMLIEGMRFNNQFSSSIIINDEINTSVIKIPSLLLQPYVENAIWHGLLHKEGDKKIEITISRNSNHSIAIYIDDNGIGRAAAKALEQRPKDHKSFGMKIGENRLRLMNTGGTQIAKVDVIDLFDHLDEPIGTRIMIVIPAKLFVEESIKLN